MKWIFFSLVLINLSLYLWATGHPRDQPQLQLGEEEINARTMMLLSERDALGNAQGICMRIGPFLTQSTFADASRQLEEIGLSYSKTAVSARKLKTYRALIAVPNESVALNSLRQKLDEISVDHYKFEDSGSEYLSVGLFSQPGDARNFVGRLKEHNIVVNYRPELRTLGPLRWIEVDTVPDQYARDELDKATWGDAMASVLTFPCAA
jgi:hypothetical protein